MRCVRNPRNINRGDRQMGYVSFLDPNAGKLNLRAGTSWRVFFNFFGAPVGPYDFLEN